MANRRAVPSGPELGLVCITSSDEVRYRTVTRTRLLREPPSVREGILGDLYEANAGRLEAHLILRGPPDPPLPHHVGPLPLLR